jgi:hypothetical protein
MSERSKIAMSTSTRETSCKKNNQLFYIVDLLPPDFGAVGQYGVIFARDTAARAVMFG